MRKQFMGLIKLGQLKRIQRVLFPQYCTNPEVLKDEIGYILKGKGQYLPVWIDEDFSFKELSENETNPIILRQLKEMDLKKSIAEMNRYNLSKPK
ncbi:MAG: hypothetical protein WDA08_03540 [Weeksellaceae bacterium]